MRRRVRARDRAALALELTDILRLMLPVLDDLVEHGVLATASWPTFLPLLTAEIARVLEEPDADDRTLFADTALGSLTGD